MVSFQVTRELLKKLPELKIVAVAGVGYNHIDLKHLKSFGVKLSNTPGVLDGSVADFSMLLLLKEICVIVSLPYHSTLQLTCLYGSILLHILYENLQLFSFLNF